MVLCCSASDDNTCFMRVPAVVLEAGMVLYCQCLVCAQGTSPEKDAQAEAGTRLVHADDHGDVPLRKRGNVLSAKPYVSTMFQLTPELCSVHIWSGRNLAGTLQSG